MARSSRVARFGAALTVAILMLAGVRLEAATSVTIAWDPNPEPEVTGYLVLYGTQPGVYSGRVDVGVRTECTLLSIPEGTYYITVEAYTADGIISAPAAEITTVVKNRLLPTTAAPDFDGDRRSDLVLWHASTGQWSRLSSKTGLTEVPDSGMRFGGLGDVPLSGDIDGDRVADLIVWRGSTGTFYWLTSSSGYTAGGSQQWGIQSLGDMPMLGDLDGDGASDLIVWRPSTGMWYWLTSSSGYNRSFPGSVAFGSGTMGDVPLIGDFDGDGRADISVWRPADGTFYWLTSSTNFSYAGARAKQWGAAWLGDTPMLGDFDGDAKSDLVVWRASTGMWYWVSSSSGYSNSAGRNVLFGSQSVGDQPFLADVDGDGKADPCVWRAITNMWYVLYSSSGYTNVAARYLAGGAGDVPVVK